MTRAVAEGVAAVVVHNADGVNPYGTEIAALLHSQGHRVTLVDPTNAEHQPPSGVTWRRLLPANFGKQGKVQQVLRLARGLAFTLWSGAVCGHVVVVSSVRFPVENIALAALAALGFPIVQVQHDPVRRRAESRLSAWGRRQILLRSTVAVVHADRLRDEVDPAALGHVIVCPHPPYTVTARAAASGSRPRDEGRRWLAFIGALRSDKGIDLVPEILSLVPQHARNELGLIVCGRGQLGRETWQRIADLGVAVEDMTSPEPVEHDTLLTVLAGGPLVLAPYVSATQSGSVILALTMGCHVLAFDKGGVPDVVSDAGLVPNGDVRAFAEAVAAGRSGGSRVPLEQWAATAARRWSGAVEHARSAAPRVRSGRRGQRQR